MSKKLTSVSRRASAQSNRVLSVAVAAALTLPASALAFEIDTGNEDLAVRFDNTVRFNVTQRVESQDPDILANQNYDDGDRNFERGHVFSRID